MGDKQTTTEGAMPLNYEEMVFFANGQLPGLTTTCSGYVMSPELHKRVSITMFYARNQSDAIGRAVAFGELAPLLRIFADVHIQDTDELGLAARKAHALLERLVSGG